MADDGYKLRLVCVVIVDYSGASGDKSAESEGASLRVSRAGAHNSLPCRRKEQPNKVV